MPRRTLTVGETIALLEETPRRVAAATRGLTDAQLRRPERAGEWSANDVLAHIRACADVRGGAVRTILAGDRPTFRAIDPRAYMEGTDYPFIGFGRSFRAFARQRAALLAILRRLPRRDWERAATVTGAGAPLERTALFYAGWVARHERPHVKQIERIARALRA